MRTLQENDELFQKLMKLKTTFLWNGFELHLNGDHIKVNSEDALKELKKNTTKDFHEFIKQ
jgi:hypothetical protein